MRATPLVLAAALALTACSADKPDGKDIDGIQVVTIDLTAAQRHTTDRVTYDRTPPAGGPHWPAQAPVAPGVLGWLRCGVYDEAVPAEFAVHSQEHGAVWLTYRTGAPAADLATFTQLAAIRPDYVIISPYAAQPGAWMASTWGAQLAVDRPDDPRLAEFTRRYAGGGQGGEKGADCKSGALPVDAEAALAKAAQPAVSASPS